MKHFCEKIGLPHDAYMAVQQLFAAPATHAQVANLKALFAKKSPDFYQEILQKPDAALWFLLLYILLAMDAKQEYEKRGIAQQIYYDTFSDITVWEAEHFAKTQQHGLMEYDWLPTHCRMELFRLGRLQFQPIAFPQELRTLVHSVPNETVLNVHIPKGPSLTQENTEDAYRQAAAFFRLQPLCFVCESWLLSPALPMLVKPQAGILLFKNRFTPLCNVNDRQAEERIFGDLCDDPADYPQNTSLQKSAAAWLAAGNQIPAAWGMFMYSA